MSSASASQPSVLLPAATVAIFSTHETSRAAVAALGNDWRFARVKFDIHVGDVGTAIQMYAHTPSPNLLIVDTDVIDASFTALLEQLAASCTDGTDAVVVGPVNDIALYRYLTQMGVADYLVRPLTADILVDVISRSLLAQLGASNSELVLVMGAKGGVGTSTIAGMVAYALADMAHHKTNLCDFSGGATSLPVLFGHEPVTTIADAARAAVASDRNVFERMLVRVTEHLQVLATGNEKYLDPMPLADQVEKIIDRLLTATPYVVVDLSGTDHSIMKTILPRAHHIVLVSLPTLSSLRAARSLINEIRGLKGGDFFGIHVVVNMAGIAPGSEIGARDIETALGVKVDISIPFDPKGIIGAETQTKILGSLKNYTKTAMDLMGLVGAKTTSIPDAQKPKSILGGLLKKGE